MFLEDRWDPAVADKLDEPELLRYRSNLLGSDLRITNFAGGNTSSKIDELDPLTGETVKVLWVKGSGGDLGSIKRTGFATLYQDKLLALEHLYRGQDTEDSMVEMYALCAFRNNPVAASIDTPLHGFLPFPHVDHLHPDWGIALAASANGKAKMEEFNREFHHKLVWVPWQRPGFELAMMLKRAVEQNPDCDGIVLGGHGLFTWGDTQRECYVNTLTVIDQLGQFIANHGKQKEAAGLAAMPSSRGPIASELAVEILPYLRGRVSANRRWIASFSDGEDVLQFVNSSHAKDLSFLGTSCPDHFIRTKIRPLFVPWADSEDVAALKSRIDETLAEYQGTLQELLSGPRAARFAGLARCQPYHRAGAGPGHVQLRQEQDGSPHHGRVLYQCDSRDGRRQSARRRRKGIWFQSEYCSAVRRRHGSDHVQGLYKLRGHAAERGVPHRVLGARRSQDQAPAGRKGTEPRRSRWSSAAAAASAVRSRCWLRPGART